MTTSQLQIRTLWSVLKYTFVIIPVAAGADKFLNLLVEWDTYIHPTLAGILPFSTSVFMMIVGIIEIAAGVIVLKWTRLGAWIVSAWLALIALSLLLSGQYLDVAVRDIAMAISAFVLAKLTEILENTHEG